jgi:hypothetical protein
VTKRAKKRRSGRRELDAEDAAREAAFQELGKTLRYLATARNEPKMSAVLIDFAQPFLRGDEPAEIYGTMMRLAALAWNASFLPAAERKDARDRFADAMGEGCDPQDYISALNLFERMTRRRLGQFGHIQRWIAEVNVTRTAGGAPRVVVASSPFGAIDDDTDLH